MPRSRTFTIPSPFCRGLLELHAFERLDLVTGSGVGGGSLIYTNVLEAPDDEFRRRLLLVPLERLRE
jgi:hypothetical protein